MKTTLCHLLGIEYPIIAAPMGPDLTGPEFVAAVSNAGGLGILQAQLCPPPIFRDEIRRVRRLTDKPFGMNLLLHFPVEDQVAVCLDERVPILSLFWGDPTPYVERAHAAGVKVFHQVGSLAEAQRAAAAGVDVIIAQGVEAGGHVAGEVSTSPWSPGSWTRSLRGRLPRLAGLPMPAASWPPWPWERRRPCWARGSWPARSAVPIPTTRRGCWRPTRGIRSAAGALRSFWSA